MDQCGEMEPWAKFALEQAEILTDYLRNGGRNSDFLTKHALAVIQASVHDPDEWLLGPTSGGYFS
jgi:hypothetical protein